MIWNKPAKLVFGPWMADPFTVGVVLNSTTSPGAAGDAPTVEFTVVNLGVYPFAAVKMPLNLGSDAVMRKSTMKPALLDPADDPSRGENETTCTDVTSAG